MRRRCRPLRAGSSARWSSSGSTTRSSPKLQLREDFGYEDQAGKLWLARQGQVLDGASIPPAFRDMIGMPFVGDYRRASVVYDYYCHVMSEPWRDVHRMFYDASLTEGVGEVNAKVMYATLYAAGLRWEMPGSSCFRSCHAAAPSLTWKPQVEESDVETRGRVDQAGESRAWRRSTNASTRC